MTEPAIATARAVLDRIEQSGYGTSELARYCPRFDVDEVRLLAEAVLATHEGEQK